MPPASWRPLTRRAAFAFIPTLESLSHLQIYAATAEHLRSLKRVGQTAVPRARAPANAAGGYRALGWTLHEARWLELAGESQRRRNATRRRKPSSIFA